MIDQELAQRAIVEALEGKIEALRSSRKLRNGSIIELCLWDDLSVNFPKIFMSAANDEVALAIAAVADESDGRFKLATIRPHSKRRPPGTAYVAGAVPLQDAFTDEAPLFCWNVRYTNVTTPTRPRIKKSIPKEVAAGTQIFWLSPREVSGDVAGKAVHFSIEKNSVEYRLLRWFAENDQPAHASAIAEDIESTTRTVQEKIRSLRTKARARLGLKGNEFIVSSNAEGYQRNPAIKLKIESSTP